MGSEGLQRASRSTWQTSLQQAVRSLDSLLELLELRREQLPPLDENPRFPLLVPLEFIARMERGNPADPLLRQVLPLAEENRVVQGFQADAVGDGLSAKAPGVLHKYGSRALLVATGMCAVHCRYCFRRHYPYEETPKSFEAWKDSLDYIADHPEIEEVIFSGGDPLSLGNSRLFGLIEAVEGIAHVSRIRIHTRFPVLIPSRIDAEFLNRIQSIHKPVWMVLHINHANEMDSNVLEAANALRKSGVILLNQAVLLRGVNDSIEIQRALNRRLVDNGIMPYYLHQLDRVSGTAHFETDESQGRSIIHRLREESSGYGVPRFVREIPGKPSKTLIE